MPVGLILGAVGGTPSGRWLNPEMLEAGIEVIGEAKDGREAVEKVGQLLPDVVLMDITMPSLNGLEATRQIKKRVPEGKVVILTVHANEEYIFQILRAGASGYLVKQAAPTELLSAIRAAGFVASEAGTSSPCAVQDRSIQKS